MIAGGSSRPPLRLLRLDLLSRVPQLVREILREDIVSDVFPEHRYMCNNHSTKNIILCRQGESPAQPDEECREMIAGGSRPPLRLLRLDLLYRVPLVVRMILREDIASDVFPENRYMCDNHSTNNSTNLPQNLTSI